MIIKATAIVYIILGTLGLIFPELSKGITLGDIYCLMSLIGGLFLLKAK